MFSLASIYLIVIICNQIIVYNDQQGKTYFVHLTLDQRVLLYHIILYNFLIKYNYFIILVMFSSMECHEVG